MSPETGGVWEAAAKYAAGGFGFGGGLISVALSLRWLIVWLTGRHDQREALLNAKAEEVDERWAAYTKRIETRCEALEVRVTRQEEEIDDCHKAKRALEERVARLEGYDHGAGDRRQIDQLAQSLDRKIESLKPSSAD